MSSCSCVDYIENTRLYAGGHSHHRTACLQFVFMHKFWGSGGGEAFSLYIHTSFYNPSPPQTMYMESKRLDRQISSPTIIGFRPMNYN